MAADIIEQVGRSIRASQRRRHAIERELRAHLEDAQMDLLRSGMTADEAVRESISRLGDPSDIAREFDSVYRPKRRTQIGLALALATGMILGVYGIGGSLASATPQHHSSVQHPHGPKMRNR